MALILYTGCPKTGPDGITKSRFELHYLFWIVFEIFHCYFGPIWKFPSHFIRDNQYIWLEQYVNNPSDVPCGLVLFVSWFLSFLVLQFVWIATYRIFQKELLTECCWRPKTILTKIECYGIKAPCMTMENIFSFSGLLDLHNLDGVRNALNRGEYFYLSLYLWSCLHINKSMTVSIWTSLANNKHHF